MEARQLTFLALAVALAVGMGIGTAVTYFVTDTGEAEASAECLEALDYADEMNEHFADFTGITVDAFDAASRLNAAGINAASERMEALTPGIAESLSGYVDAAELCRGE